MNGIEIILSEATERGRLYYQPDPEVEHYLFCIQSAVRRKGVSGINVASLILFTLDENRSLTNIEFVIPRKAWIKSTNYEMPKANRSADIAIAKRALQQEYIEPAVSAITSDDFSSVQVIFGDFEASDEWIALSEKCLALVSENRLKGFFVDFT